MIPALLPGIGATVEGEGRGVLPVDLSGSKGSGRAAPFAVAGDDGRRVTFVDFSRVFEANHGIGAGPAICNRGGLSAQRRVRSGPHKDGSRRSFV